MDRLVKVDKTVAAYAGAAVATAAVAIAAGQWLASTRVPHGEVKETLTFDTDEQENKAYGGLLVAKVLQNHNVKFLFTLCGGHISPILVGCKALGIRVVDVRDEANAAFAADAVSRLTGTVGVCAVTAGPGLTNTITAVKNCQMAQSPLLVLGGATSDLLKNRASLQDIDQFAIIKSCVKWSAHIGTVDQIVPTLEKALFYAQDGTPGPVFIELPVDVLYPKEVVVGQFNKMKPSKSSLVGRVIGAYVDYHARSVFGRTPKKIDLHAPVKRGVRSAPSSRSVSSTLSLLRKATKPVMIIGSQTLLLAEKAVELQQAVQKLGVPTFLSGMGRGLLGKSNPLQIRHNRRNALKEADLVILAGVPMDFRLEYGQGIPRRTTIVSINLDNRDLYLNRWPTHAILADPTVFLLQLASQAPNELPLGWQDWHQHLLKSDQKRETEIDEGAAIQTDLLNPVYFCRRLDEEIGDNAILIGDGGDFVGTCAYTVKPRGPLGWLDPGPFGTLGIGMGFAIGAKCVNPDKEVWVLFGDGAAGFSLVEIDTLTRLCINVIVVIGNDACWRQIERDQVAAFHDDVGCALTYTKYEEMGKALGAEGFVIDNQEDIVPILKRARELYAQGKSVVINAKLSKHDFRKGSMSL